MPISMVGRYAECRSLNAAADCTDFRGPIGPVVRPIAARAKGPGFKPPVAVHI